MTVRPPHGKRGVKPGVREYNRAIPQKLLIPLIVTFQMATALGHDSNVLRTLESFVTIDAGNFVVRH